MVKSMLTFATIVLVFEALFAISQFTSSAEASQLNLMNCNHVIQNPNDVRRELVSRNLDNDHKIIKFIENCIKSVDGWRFKKSGPSRTAASNNLAAAVTVTKSGAVALPERALPYPVHFVLLRQLPTQQHAQTKDSPKTRVSQEVSEGQQQNSRQSQEQQSEQESEPQFFGYNA